MNKYLFAFILFALCGCASSPEGFAPISTNEKERIFKKYDDVKKITTYEHKNFFLDSPIRIYILEGKERTLRIMFKKYQGSRVFFERADLIDSAGTRVSFSYNPDDIKTEALGAGNVSEYADEKLPDDKAEAIMKLLDSRMGDITLKMSGKHYVDYILTTRQINGMVEMLNFYKNK